MDASASSTAPPGPARGLAPPVGRVRAGADGGHRRHVTVHETVMGFVAWMREEELVGWLLSADLPEALGWYCEAAAIEKPPLDMFRAGLAKAPGVKAERRRLASLDGSAALRALKLRAKKDRADLYYFASQDEIEAEAAAVRQRAVQRPGRGRSRAGEDVRLAA